METEDQRAALSGRSCGERQKIRLQVSLVHDILAVNSQTISLISL